LRHLKHLSKLHLQYCAIASQQNKHEKALEHAKYGLKYAGLVLDKTINIAEKMCNMEINTKQNTLTAESSVSKAYSSDPIIESVAKKVLPVLYSLRSRINNHSNTETLDMRNLFGYCQITEWCANINMSSIMQISPMTFQDFASVNNDELELTREFLLEKISLVIASYFCISTEKRFIGNPTTMKQAEYWHSKTLELACQYLPADCPLLLHVYNSYQKQYSILQQAIVVLYMINSLKM